MRCDTSSSIIMHHARSSMRQALQLDELGCHHIRRLPSQCRSTADVVSAGAKLPYLSRNSLVSDRNVFSFYVCTSHKFVRSVGTICDNCKRY
ncbi:hypothetical protein PILCRDRAFT_192222 [Piloderma croceum F 1598]|uniref:Uncharacterized protein n=1 Tax=Piloderma croceum (strain F 1598) TaxID=765440 RepID=A0A0C3G0D9_PILCF|nr:hypothetical protein PILCRDRAFT_192222 [Piloderma croceum F 1598]